MKKEAYVEILAKMDKGIIKLENLKTFVKGCYTEDDKFTYLKSEVLKEIVRDINIIRNGAKTTRELIFREGGK